MTISELTREASPVTTWPVSPQSRRYAQDLLRRRTATYPGLVDAIQGPPLYRLDSPADGLTTVAVWQSQLPGYYLAGLLGFRLAQFLEVGLIDPELVYRLGLTHEPCTDPTGPETVHVVTLTTTGAIVGYLALVGSPDPEPMLLDNPDRQRFPAEVAHGVDLLAGLAAPGRTTHTAWEIKRFVRDAAMPAGPQRERVPWHLILAVGKVVLALGDRIQVVLGDSAERGALRHLRLLGLHLDIVEGTTPRLPRTELMWLSYEQGAEQRAKPFVGVLQPGAADVVEVIQAALLSTADEHWRSRVLAGLALLQALNRTATAAEGRDR